MTDKVQKIREEVVRMHNLLPVVDGDNISVNYADRICTTLEMYIDSMQDEPVSEDLREAARKYFKSLKDDCFISSDIMIAFKAGAKWQETKDQETIETAIHHAYHNGKLEMKEQMMAKAIDGVTRPDDNEVWCDLNPFNFKDGDKVKVIVIKED